MSNRHDPLLDRVATATFESMAFLLRLPEEEAPPEARPRVVAGVEFAGPFRGELLASVSWSMLPALSANMLGMMEEMPAEEQQYDALKELVNVVCGNLLPELAGHEAVFDVQAPAILSLQELPESREPLECVGRVRMALDEGMAELVLFVESGAALAA